ncbi:hypothetical protein N9W34_06140 [Rickettsiales bacterium]|nr:hypothetical protein [Rickettsiales bacterium]
MPKNHESTPEILSFTQRYKPLLVIIATVAFSAAALALVDGHMHRFMETFMGLFFVNFAMLKLIDLKGFADGFSMYDLVAKRSRTYALAYPFIELGLGLLYLTAFLPIATNILTLIFMLISGAGVIKAIITSDKKLQCSCLGTILNVPLSTVSVIENFGMAAMATFMLWQSWR